MAPSSARQPAAEKITSEINVGYDTKEGVLITVIGDEEQRRRRHVERHAMRVWRAYVSRCGAEGGGEQRLDMKKWARRRDARLPFFFARKNGAFMFTGSQKKSGTSKSLRVS